MSGLAKVFLVINFILAIIFLGTSATLFSVRKDFKKEMTDLNDSYKEQFDKQLKEIKALSEKANKQAVALGVQQAEITNFRAANSELTTKVSSLQTNLSTAKTDIATKDSRIETLNNDLSTLSNRVDALSNNLATANKDKENALEETRTSVAQKQRALLDQQQTQTLLVKATKELNEKNEQLEIALTTIEILNTGGKGPVKPIEGKILSLEGDYVMLSVGKDEGVTPGMTFKIYRGSNYLGEVKVRNVYADSAGAVVESRTPHGTMKEGDNASTRLN